MKQNRKNAKGDEYFCEAPYIIEPGIEIYSNEPKYAVYLGGQREASF